MDRSLGYCQMIPPFPSKGRVLHDSFLLLLIFCVGCSESPFGEDIETTSTTTLAGKVVLDNRENPEGVYIWLEGTNINTHTDDQGDFHIELPKSSPGQSALESGVFNLYYYVANYLLVKSTVLVEDGEFVRSRGDVNGKGELIGTKPLVKLLNIITEVEPTSVGVSHQGSIGVTVSLRALGDSVTVALPKSIEVPLGAVIFKKMATGEATLYLAPEGDQRLSIEKIGPDERILQYDFVLVPGMLPEGEYEIVPFFIIQQENMPPGLLASLGGNAEEIGPDFLKIPFKREGGYFSILGI